MIVCTSKTAGQYTMIFNLYRLIHALKKLSKTMRYPLNLTAKTPVNLEKYMINGPLSMLMQ